MVRRTDIKIENHGSVVLLRPMTDKASDWLVEAVDLDTWASGAVVCEPRYVANIVAGAVEAGLEVR